MRENKMRRKIVKIKNIVTNTKFYEIKEKKKNITI